MAKQYSNIIAVASGKGGVGKTWLSITMSHVFASSGRRTLLFDGDIGLANVDVQLGLHPKYDLGDVISGKATLKEAMTRFDGGNFDIIAGRSGSGSLATLPTEKMNSLKQNIIDVAKEYDAVVLDLGAGIEQHVQFLANIAERCLVVVTDEPTSLTDAYAFIKVLRMRNADKPEIRVVVNQAGNAKEGEKTYGAIKNACENFLKFTPPLAGIIRRDTKVKESIKSQTSILVKNAKATASTDVAALAVKLMAKG